MKNQLKNIVLKSNTWDLNQDGKLQIAGSGTFSQYTTEMTALNNLYRTKNPNLAGNRQVLFAVNAADEANSNLAGDMPLASQFGYLICGNITAENIARTAAHEIAHGLFQLRHIWEYDLDKGSTDNLMDYSTGTRLIKFQWDELFDKKDILFPEFQGEDVGKTLNELGWVNFYKENDDNSVNTFLAPSGLTISIKGKLEQCLLASKFGTIFYGSDIYDKSNLTVYPEGTNQTSNGSVLISDGEKYIYGFRIKNGENYDEYLASLSDKEFYGFIKAGDFYSCDPQYYKNSYQVHKWKGITSNINTSESWNIENSIFDPMSDNAIKEKNVNKYLAAGNLATDLQNGLDNKYLTRQVIAFTKNSTENSFLAPSGLVITLKGTLQYCIFFTEDENYDLPDDMKLANDPNSPNTIKVSHDVLYGFILDTHVYLAKFSSLGFEGYFSDDKEINSYYFDKETFNETAVVVNLLDNNENWTNRVTCTKYFIENKTAFDYRAQGQIISDDLFRHFTTDCTMPEIPNPFGSVIPLFEAISPFQATQFEKVRGLSIQTKAAGPMAGVSSSYSLAQDQFQNFAFIYSDASFANLFTAQYSSDENNFWFGNFCLGALAGISVSNDLYLNINGKGYKDVTQLAGSSINTEITGAFMLDFGISSIFSTEGEFKGVSFSYGVGVGGALSSMSSNSFVFAFTIQDLETMNAAINNINNAINSNNQELTANKKYFPLFLDGTVEKITDEEGKPFIKLWLILKGFNTQNKNIEVIITSDLITLGYKDNCIYTFNVKKFEDE